MDKSEEELIEIFVENAKIFETYTTVGQITSFACLTTVIGQFMFNSFSDFQFPFDKWAIFDLANAMSNTICYGMFLTMNPEQFVISPGVK